MRIFWVSIMVLFILIISAIYLNQFLLKSTQGIMDVIELMEAKVKQKDWTGLKEEFIFLQREWKSILRLWKLFIEHEEIDKIQLRVVELKEYINHQDEILTKANLSALKYLVRHIYTKNRLNTGNIF